MTAIELLDKILLYTPLIITLTILLLLLAIPSKNIKSKRWLILMVFTSMLSLLPFFIHFFFRPSFELYIDSILIPAVLTVVVFKYLFALSLVKEIRFNVKLSLHFLPFFALSIALFISFFYMSEAESIFYINNRVNHQLLLSLPEYRFAALFHIVVFRVIFLAQTIYYTFKIYRLAKEHQQNLINLSSNIQAVAPSWLHQFNVISLIYRVVISLLLLLTYKEIEVRIGFNMIISLITVFFIIFAITPKTIAGLLKPETSELLNLNSEENQIQNIVYEPIVNNNYQNLKLRLIDYFEKEEPFLNPEMKIDDLCAKLNTNRSYLSKIINNEFGLNFNNFVNQHRVLKAKEILSNESFSNYSINGVAKMSGFKSTSAFYKAFGQIVGKTPTDFRNITKKTF